MRQVFSGSVYTRFQGAIHEPLIAFPDSLPVIPPPIRFPAASDSQDPE
jgi:ubiquitin-protein ligase